MTGTYHTFVGERGKESISDIARRSVGLPTNNWNVAGTGTFAFPANPILNMDDDTMMDKLVARMMVHTSKVITPCKWCGSHNAFSNPTCVQCGGPLG